MATRQDILNKYKLPSLNQLESEQSLLSTLAGAGKALLQVPQQKEELGVSFRSGILQTASALETTLSQAAKNLGLKAIGEKLATLSASDKDLSRVGINVQDPVAFSKAIQDPKFMARGIAMNAPNLLGALGAGIIGTTVGGPVGGIASIFAFSGSLEGGFAFQDAKEFGLSDEEAQNVGIIVGVANGILETIPVTRFLNRLKVGRQIKKNILKNITKGVILQTVEESGTEALQEIVSNAVAQSYDENRELLQGVSESAYFGAILGGGVGITGGISTAAGGTIRGLEIEDVSGISEEPQIDTQAIRQTEADIAEAFREVSIFLEITEPGGQLIETPERTLVRARGVWPPFLPIDLRSKKNVKVAQDLLEGKEPKTKNQKRIYQSMLSYVSSRVGEDRFNDFSYTQLLEQLEIKASVEQKQFAARLVSDLKKLRKPKSVTEIRTAIKKNDRTKNHLLS